MSERGYRVLIVINHPKVKSQWWSDQKVFKKLSDAQHHRRDVAERWSDCDTAIASPRNEVLFYRDSILEQRRFAAMVAA